MNEESEVERQSSLIEHLRNPAVYAHHVTTVTLLETHISYVLLTGTYAYKIKKAVALDFLDFRTLEARRHFCEEEVRLNRRLAPEVYLGVVSIGGSAESPAVGGRGPSIEYAVQMREFPQSSLFSRLIASGSLTPAHIDKLAFRVAAFHASIEVAPHDGPLGTPATVRRIALENFGAAGPLDQDASERADLDTVRLWTEREYSTRASALQHRLDAGYVRECHGDLHLGNIALVDNAVTIFDCIEFNDEMRWIDVMSEVAFTVMDLLDRGRSDLAFRFLNAYLEVTGDYLGMNLFRFYLTYRAMVRAKVTALRIRQIDSRNRTAPLGVEYRTFLDLALAWTRPPRPALVVTHGLAGSGKTTCSQMLIESLGGIRLRTDVERKRLHGLGATTRSHSSIAAGLYADEETDRLYRSLQATARELATAGYLTVVDGAFLKRWQRDLFRDLARALDMPFIILAVEAPDAVARTRILERSRRQDDASEADEEVLEHQRRTEESIGEDETAFVVRCNTSGRVDIRALTAAVLERRRERDMPSL